MATDTAPVSTSAAARIWQAPVFLLGLLALAAVTIGRPYLLQFSPNSPAHILTTARTDLAQNPGAIDRVVESTMKLVERTDLTAKELGEAHFILGSALLRRIDTGNATDANSIKSQARHHLEQAERLGVADADRTTLGIRLAKVWMATGTDPKQIIPVLFRAADTAEDPFEAFGLLAEAYGRMQPPDAANIVEATRQQVARAPSNTDPTKLARARLRLAELFLDAQNTREARIVLMRLGNEAPPEILFTARRLLAKCHEEAQDWAAAARAWEQTRNDPRLPQSDKARVLYALGRANYANHQPNEAIAAWQAAMALGGPEAQASAIRLAELQLATDPKSALSALGEALKVINKPEDYQNSVASLAEVQSLLEKAGEQLVAKSDFSSAIELAKLYSRIAPAGKALAMQALAAAAWADALQSQGQNDTALVQRAEAARNFAQAAGQVAPSTESAFWLWQSADLALKCKDYRQAIEALKPFVEMEAVVGADRIAEAWLTTGQVYEQLKNPADATAAYRRCLQFTGNIRFKARYALAQLNLTEARRDDKVRQASHLDDAEKLQLELRAKVKYDDAEKLLQENIAELRQSVQPDVLVQEQTVFGLADIAYERRDFATAEPRLKGAIQEFPEGANVVRARYRLGLCVWNRAVEEYKSLSNEKLSDPERQRVQKQYLDSLTTSIDLFGQVDKALAAKNADRSADDQEMLTRAAFSVAELQALAGKYREALESYEGLAKRFEGRVEGLHAIHQVWHCLFHYLDDKTRAVEQLARLRDAVEKTPDTVFDGSSPMHNRNYWFDKIVDMGKQPVK